MIRRQEVSQLLALYIDLLESVESLRNNLYSTNDSFDDESVYRQVGELSGAIIDLGDIAKEMDDTLLAKEMRNGKEDEE